MQWLSGTKHTISTALEGNSKIIFVLLIKTLCDEKNHKRFGLRSSLEKKLTTSTMSLYRLPFHGTLVSEQIRSDEGLTFKTSAILLYLFTVAIRLLSARLIKPNLPVN